MTTRTYAPPAVTPNPGRHPPPAPIAVDGNDWEQFRSVVANNNPVALRIEAEPAPSTPSGGAQ
ncbi:MAG: hypothetical protein OXH42_14795, partial [Acidimicrobiaceae bacterium]|nr:hypothetical protein [Acidimicrobiaceae bacterium]